MAEHVIMSGLLLLLTGVVVTAQIFYVFGP